MYKATIESFPGSFLLFTASLYLVVGVLLFIANRGLVGVERKRKAAEDDQEDQKRLTIEE